jgi:two-component system nitrogen regulation response regulator GlnG
VLITGESGSGKELVARALHKHSPVANGPFVAINTAAIPKDLLESELFGHERGAFTGAQTQRRGRFEQAEGGTLFLDEIGDMPFELQTAAARAVGRAFLPRGRPSAVKANVRVIAATHQDLEQRVKDGVFREDLFHRLNVIRLRLPPLRERGEDVPMLARHFLQQSAKQLGVEPKRIAPEALQRLTQFSFPGNVRQLENICHWLTVMAPAQVISVQDLPPEVLHTRPARRRSRPWRRNTVRCPWSALRGTPPGCRRHAVWSYLPASQAAGAGAVEAAVAALWDDGLSAEATRLLAAGHTEVWDALSRRFESRLIRAALGVTHGRRMEAAQRWVSAATPSPARSRNWVQDAGE